MDLTVLALPAFALMVVASLLLLVTRNRRLSIFALACQYGGSFFLIGLNWSLEMAVSVLLAGWTACIILGISSSEDSLLTGERWQETEHSWPSGSVFRLFTATLAVLTVISLAPKIIGGIPEIHLVQIWGGLILIGFGVLQLGLSSQPTRVIMGLLTILLGFEIIYSAMESSLLVAGLLAFVTLGLALIGAYLVAAPLMEDAG